MYFNGRLPPANYFEWHEFATTHHCSLDHSTYQRIENDLQPFRDRHARCLLLGLDAGCKQDDPIITPDMLEAAGRMDRVRRIEIKQGRIIGSDAWPMNHIMMALQEFATDLPDMVVYFNELDEPRVLRQPLAKPEAIPSSLRSRYDLHRYQTRSPGQSIIPLMSQICRADLTRERMGQHGFFLGPNSFSVLDQLVPIFSQATISDCFSDILFPSIYYLANEAEEEATRSLPWQNKSDKLYWRGSSTGGFANTIDKFRQFHRQRLVESFGKRSNLFDIGFTTYTGCEGDVCEKAKTLYGQPIPKEPFAKVGEIKYLADIDGNSFSRRILSFMRYSGSLVFRAALFEDWLMDQVRDGEHFIRLDLDLHDLNEKLTWARENDMRAKHIAEKATRFAASRLRREDMVCYLYRSLLEYQRLTAKPTQGQRQ